MKKLLALMVFSLFTIPALAREPVQAMTDQQVKSRIIQESIASYPGNCPCPYNTARNGSRCGKRSAWSRPGGYSPICFETDVTDAMVRNWRQRNR